MFRDNKIANERFRTSQGVLWYYKSVIETHQYEGVEHLRLFLYNEGVIGLAWRSLDFASGKKTVSHPLL